MGRIIDMALSPAPWGLGSDFRLGEEKIMG
jgi:hypothetical protein